MNGDLSLSHDTHKKYLENVENEINKISDNEIKQKAIAASIGTNKNGVRHVTSSMRIRNLFISKYVKNRANGICEWLSRNGADSIDNAVALDPNCHKRMHVLDDKCDVRKLKEKIISYR